MADRPRCRTNISASVGKTTLVCNSALEAELQQTAQHLSSLLIDCGQNKNQREAHDIQKVEESSDLMGGIAKFRVSTFPKQKWPAVLPQRLNHTPLPWIKELKEKSKRGKLGLT
jgi:hypothetical protein